MHCWPIPDLKNESLFADLFKKIVDTVYNRDTGGLAQLLEPCSLLWEQLEVKYQERFGWFEDHEIYSKVRKRCSDEKIADFISLYPSEPGIISAVDIRIDNEIDPSGELRRLICQRVAEDKADETEESEDICEDDKYEGKRADDQEEETGIEVQANPEKPCYYPAQIEMAAILKKRIDTIMSHYHNISSLSDAFNDVEFAVYTARFRMLSDQTEKRICHPDAGVLSQEELKSPDNSGRKKRMFMYTRNNDTEKHFEELKKNVQENPKTLFVIIADECHWGITKDKEENKPSAHNLFVNEWCKGNSPHNVVVVQISATPFNLLTQNSRLPDVRCVLLSDKVSTAQRDYKEGDLVVLEKEPNLEEHVKKNSKEVELHMVHWSEVELKNFERGMRMKLKSTLNIEDAPYKYLCVSPDGMLGVTSIEDDANDFIVQGSHGIITLKVLANKEQQQEKPFILSQDAHGNLEAKVDPEQPTKFEIKLDFGVGVVAFFSCEKPDHYLAVDNNGYVSLQPAKVERKCGVSIMKPKRDVGDISSVSFQFYTAQCGPAEVNMAGKQYMSLNFYLSTINSANKNEQKIREDTSFQELVKSARKQGKPDSPSFPIDALLCAEYCYHILHVSVYGSEEKKRQVLISSIEESPCNEFDTKFNKLVSKMREETEISKCIHPATLEFVRKELSDRASCEFQEKLRQLVTLQKRKTTKDKQEENEEVMAEEELANSFVTCLMHLSRQEMQEIMEKKDSRSISNVEGIKQKLRENGCQTMVQKWDYIVQGGETSFLVNSLVQSGKEKKGKMGKMKIVRAKTRKTANEFYYTVLLARTVSSCEKVFEVIRDYGGVQIEEQMMNPSSPFFERLQPINCSNKFDCSCSQLNLECGRKKCTECHHVHKLITQYEDLENLAGILILVDKGRMGDTFPQSFDCLDLRLSSSEFNERSSLYLSTIIQELGRLCRYTNQSTSECPYVLVGQALFKKLQDSLSFNSRKRRWPSPSMSAIFCDKVDRYMTKSSTRKDATSSSQRWLEYEAQKDSYDYQNVQKHCNRILLQAEPQIGKTGTYLCLIRELRLDIVKRESVSYSSAPASDEGVFYQHKECHLSEDLVVSEMEKRQDWKYPYWKTIQNSKSLIEKPVASGKYSIGGCFYTHDMEESPYILMNLAQKYPTKSGHQYQTRECADSIRAWHWYHFEQCAECGRILQGKEPVSKTFIVNIDGRPVAVESSIPRGRPSFKHLLEQLKDTRSTEETNAAPSPYWIFHASHRDDPRKCTLNYHHVLQENGNVHDYVQIVVVRNEKFETYRSTWGKVLAIVQLPDELPNCDVGPSEGGVGYARLFIQKMAFALNQEYVFMIDDNVVAMSEAVFSTGDPSATEGTVLRDDNGVMQMQRCSFLKPLTHLQKIVQGKDTRSIDERNYEPHPLTDEFKSQEVPLYTYTGPAKLFGDKQHESYGILGLIRSIPVAVNPFSKTQVYAAILLNVKSTVEKGVFYRPWPCWEDLRFNDDCDKAGLWVVKCNRYSFLKVQYKDWINNLARPKIFEWEDDSILEERPLSSELPINLEEDIILEHLRNFVNIQGPGKCFKGCIGYDSQEDIAETVSPVRIVQEVNANEGTEEAFASGTPVLILSYCVTKDSLQNLNLLNSRFCTTKEKIVFVITAKEAIEMWPQMTVASIPKRICFCSEMKVKSAHFSIFSAADPKWHRLRYVLIEASLSQDEGPKEEETRTIRERNLVNTTDGSYVEKGTTSDGARQTSKVQKSRKRLNAGSPNYSVQIKRPNITDNSCGHQDLTSSDHEREGHALLINTLKRKSKENNSIQSEGCRHQETLQDGYDMLGIDTAKRVKIESVTDKVQDNNYESCISTIKSYGAKSVTRNHAPDNELQSTLCSEDREGQTEDEYNDERAIDVIEISDGEDDPDIE